MTGETPQSPTKEPEPAPQIDVAALMGDATEAALCLGDQVYRLRITRAGKLILTK